MKQLNWLAIPICLVVGMGFGFLWYGALFQDAWAAANNLTFENDIFRKNGVEVQSSAVPMIINGISMLVYALILAWLISKTNMWGFVKGATVGLAVGAIACIDRFVTNLFAFNPVEASVYDGVYIVILIALLGGVVGLFKKK
jgi:hypothetical protein